MPIYTKVLKQNGSFKLDPEPVPATEDLTVAIKNFFSHHEAGIHVAVVCTDKPNEVMNEEDFQTALSCELLRSDGSSPTSASRVYARRGPFELIGQALEEILDCVKQRVDENYIVDDVSEAISAYIVIEKFKNGPAKKPGHLWDQAFAARISIVLDVDKLKADGQTVPDLRVLLLLPKSHFDIFSDPTCYFPIFLEYVVLGEDGAMLFEKYQNEVKQLKEEKVNDDQKHLRERQKDQEKIRQLEDKVKQLEEEKVNDGQKHLREHQKDQEKIRQLEEQIQRQAKSKQMRKEATQEYMKRLQEIDAHDRFLERPEGGIDPGVMEYRQGAESRSTAIEKNSSSKEKQDQMEPSGYEAQTTKLSERTSEYLDGKDRQMNIEEDRSDRSDDRGDTGR